MNARPLSRCLYCGGTGPDTRTDAHGLVGLAHAECLDECASDAPTPDEQAAILGHLDFEADLREREEADEPHRLDPVAELGLGFFGWKDLP